MQSILVSGTFIDSSVCRTHDMTGSGTITFPEFQRLHQFLSTMQNSFIFFDVDRNGELTFDEVARALQQSGGWSSKRKTRKITGKQLLDVDAGFVNLVESSADGGGRRVGKLGG